MRNLESDDGKRPKAIKVSKAKGHATSVDVERGRVRSADKMGNDIADKQAALGMMLFGPTSLHLQIGLPRD